MMYNSQPHVLRVARFDRPLLSSRPTSSFFAELLHSAQAALVEWRFVRSPRQGVVTRAGGELLRDGAEAMEDACRIDEVRVK